MKHLFLTALICALGVRAVRAELHYEIAQVSSPTGPNASCASLTNAPTGEVWLIWIEPSGKEEHALKFSTFDRATSRWGAAQLITRGRNWTISGADVPSLVVQANGRLTAVWSVNNPLSAHAHGADTAHAQHAAGHHAYFSQSKDGGETWSAPQRLTRESDIVEFVSLRSLADGTLLAAWLDGRGKKMHGPQQLFSRILGAAQPDSLIDASVCDCCPTALTGFPDGSALIAYRGRTSEEIRDVLSRRYIDGQWEKRPVTTLDNWRIAGCPVNGPRIASHGPRVGKVWFTAAYEQPCVLVAMSSDAGSVYTRSMRADLGKPLGRPDTLVLRDGSQLVTWLEQGSTAKNTEPSGGGLYLRRYGGSGATHVPVRLASLTDVRGAGHPRIALVKDFDGTPAQFLAAFTRAGEPSHVETLLITLPDAAILAEADSSCACAPRGEELVGYPIRAQVLETAGGSDALRVRHRAVPGLLRAGEREFKVAAEVLATVKAGSDILARIEQRDGDWVMFDVRLLGPPQK